MRLAPRCRSSLPAPASLVVLLVLFAAALAPPPAARAQGAALSTDLDLSVRAAGMGRCSNGVSWGENLDAWSNPALLGYQSGLRYENGRTQLVPDLASDVFLTSNRIAAGAYGLGFLFAGKPSGSVGSVHLDYGVSQATSQTGEPLGTFHSYEDVDSWGVGLSVGRAAGSLVHALTGHTPRLLRHADVALGTNRKDVTVNLFPALPGFPVSGQGTGTADDQGIFFRLSPYNSFDGPGFSHALDRALKLAVDVGYGSSTLNRHQPLVTFGDGSTRHMTQERHKGWAARLALHPVALQRSLENRHLRWLERSLFPAVSLGGAWDRNTLDFRFDDPATGTSTTRSYIVDRGFELTLLNVLSLRRGHVSDPDGAVHGATSGWGVGYALEGAIGVRYDRATVPQATDPTTGQRLADVHRRSWTVFVDPLRWWADHHTVSAAARP